MKRLSPSRRNNDEGMALAMNQPCNYDSVGAISGSLMGAQHGSDGIPKQWLDRLELNDVIVEIATDLAEHYPSSSEKPTL